MADEEDGLDETVRSLRDQTRSLQGRTSESSDAVFRVADGLERLGERYARIDKRMALIESQMGRIPTATEVAIISERLSVMVREVARLEKLLYGVAGAVGLEILRLIGIYLGLPTHA